MRHRFLHVLLLGLTFSIGLPAVSSARDIPNGTLMAEAATRFVASLSPEKVQVATYPFTDPERLNWHYIPRPRKGLPIKAMNSAQRSLAFGLLKSGLSDEGFLKATTIMALEEILLVEEKGSGPVRDPELYFFTVFGTPADQGKWGWRVEGHHLSLNYTLENGVIISASPSFFGSNPAEVRPTHLGRIGMRNLVDIEGSALALIGSLDPDQKKQAVVSEKAVSEVRGGNLPQAPASEAVGIAYKDLNETQQGLLLDTIQAYADDLAPEAGQEWLGQIKLAGYSEIHFAWTGVTDRSGGHAYVIQGPTFVIELNNTQNSSNHIHSLRRSLVGDFSIPITTSAATAAGTR